MSSNVISGGGGRLPVGGNASWTFGRGGAYADLAVPLSQARFVPATVRLPAGGLLSDLASAPGADAVRALSPQLWRGAARRGGGPATWPLLIDFGDPAKRAPLDLARIQEALASFVLRVVERSGAEPVFSLNAPLPAAAVVAGPGPSGPAPIAPDAGVLAKLAAGPGRLVAMAVIDDGLPFAHRGLLNSAGDGTRVEYCWLQSAAADASMLFGREYTRAGIDTLRALHGPDEDAIYARSGALDDAANLAAGSTPTLGRFASHGAHVLDAAAGALEDGQDLDLMRVIAVQLPAATTIDTAGYGKEGPILAAFHYVFEAADRIAEAYLGSPDAPLPLVINFSYGFTGGPHDGSDPLEVEIAALVAARNAAGKTTELVMPAGNSYADRTAGEIQPAQAALNQPFLIPWRLQPNDATASYLEIWLPADGAAADYSLALTDPIGGPVLADAPLAVSVGGAATPTVANLLLGGKIIGEASMAPFNAGWTRALITLAPTEPRDASLPAAPAGLWSVALTRTGGAPPSRPIACRIQRDNDPFGYHRGGRQSYFDSADDRPFTDDGAPSRIDNPAGVFVRRFGTVNGLATHGEVTLVTSHFADTGRATDYAGAGPASGAPAPGAVQMSMPADASTALRGALAAGTRSGSALRLSGTSMAAPLHARRAALLLMSAPLAPLQPQPLTMEISAQELAERPARLGQAYAAG